MVVAFTAALKTHPIHNDFRTYWSSLWKPITQQCLNVAKHEFVMQKALELFQVHVTRLEHISECNEWSNVFVCKEETNILKSLCRHVQLQEDEFLDYGFSHHRNHCWTYFTDECRVSDGAPPPRTNAPNDAAEVNRTRCSGSEYDQDE